MAISKTFLICLTVLVVTLAEPREATQERSNTDSEIVEFLKAHDKTWVYNTTEENKENITCRFDFKHNITEKDVFFKRYNNSSSEELLKGEFLNWNDPGNNTYDAMYVSDMQGEPVTYEVVEFVSSDKSCAVVSVTLMRTVPTYVLREIRVSEDALKKGPDVKCREKFEDILKVAKKKAKSHYSDDCKSKLNVY
uniref:Putative lipocalin-3 1 n=1 Tax=Amblyomma cajennense TaxID=34607 RepID=A0A023FRW6_AMBCJ